MKEFFLEYETNSIKNYFIMKRFNKLKKDYEKKNGKHSPTYIEDLEEKVKSLSKKYNIKYYIFDMSCCECGSHMREPYYFIYTEEEFKIIDEMDEFIKKHYRDLFYASKELQDKYIKKIDEYDEKINKLGSLVCKNCYEKNMGKKHRFVRRSLDGKKFLVKMDEEQSSP